MSNFDDNHKPAAMPWGLLVLIVIIGAAAYFYLVNPSPAINLIGERNAAIIGLTEVAEPAQ